MEFYKEEVLVCYKNGYREGVLFITVPYIHACISTPGCRTLPSRVKMPVLLLLGQLWPRTQGESSGGDSSPLR